MSVRLGLDRIRDEGFRLPGAGRIGLVANAASVGRDFLSAPEVLLGLSGVRLDRIFSPQHGYGGEKQDNMIESGHGTHSVTGLPIFSLYGEVREPTDEMLDGLDAVVFDVPDVGTRVYTFFITMLHVMRAAGRRGLPVYILDRPNPIGPRIDGPILSPEFRSFVGLAPVPLQHGLTAGEYASFGRAALGLDVDLQVVTMNGWRRNLPYELTGVPWVFPSPNMPTLETAVVYPGGVMLEGVNLSEGRGTTRPFELFGAPWIEPRGVVSEIVAARRATGGNALEGALLRQVSYEPTFHKFRGETVHGFQMHVLDRKPFRPVLAYIEVFRAIRAHHGRLFDWRKPPYEYETEKLPIDLITGNARTRQAIEDDIPAVELAREWMSELDQYRDAIRPHLLYSGGLV
ncbi:MAG: DUF1343 domain-containing protein [Candidatus Eisenbacteria bacterium]